MLLVHRHFQMAQLLRHFPNQVFPLRTQDCTETQVFSLHIELQLSRELHSYPLIIFGFNNIQNLVCPV